MKIINGMAFLTNNESTAIHDIKMGFMHFQIRNQMGQELLRYLTFSGDLSDTSPFNENYDRPVDLIDTIGKTTNDKLKSLILDYNQAHLKYEQGIRSTETSTAIQYIHQCDGFGIFFK